MNQDTGRAVKWPSGGNGSLDLILVARLVVAVVLFAAALILKSSTVVTVILLIISAIVAGYDIALGAVNFVEAGDYFATPIIILAVTVLSFVIGYPTEGALVMILYQLGLMGLNYAEKRTKESALDIVRYQDEDTVKKVKDRINETDAGDMSIENEIGYNASFVLKAAIVFAVLFAILIPIITSMSFRDAVHRALVVIVVSTPLSTVVSIPLTGIVGMCLGGRYGVVFENSRIMEATSDTNTVIFDKVGIFSEEYPKLVSVQSDILDTKTFMSFAAHSVYYSSQPFAKTIGAAHDQDYKLEVISDFNDIPGCGVTLKIGGAEVIFATRELYENRGLSLPEQPTEMGTTYYMTVSGRYVGKIVVADDVNQESIELVSSIKDSGVDECYLVSEDGKDEAERFAEQLGFDKAFGGLDTAGKLDTIKEIDDAHRGRGVMYVYSSGIEGHSAATIDMRVSKKGKYADALVVPGYLSYLPSVLQICARVRELASENAIGAFIIKAIIIFLGITGVCDIWFAIFLDMVAAIATVLNSIRVSQESLLNKFLYRFGK